MNRLKKVLLAVLSCLCVNALAIGMASCEGVMVTPNGSGGFLVTPNASTDDDSKDAASSDEEGTKGETPDDGGEETPDDGKEETPDDGGEHEHSLNEYGYCEECGFLSENHIHCEGETEWNDVWYCEGGVVEMWCIYCPYTWEKTYIGIGHSFTEVLWTEEPTCYEEGYTEYGCSNGCGVTENRDFQPITHKILDHNAKEPTCTEVGWYAYETCENCSYTTYEERAKLGHSYTNYVSNNDVTCTQDGTKTATCDNGCGKTDTVTDKAAGHTIVTHEAKAPTCTAIGWYAYETCENCSYTTYQERAATGQHSYTKYISNNDTTCTQDGTKTAACDYGCGKTNTITDKAAGHKIVSYEGKAPTCTAIGWYAYETCENCTYTTYQERAKLGHSYTNYVSNNDATCTQDGTKTAACDYGCGKTDTVTDKAAGHKIVTHEGKAPTCTAIGWYAYETCENCTYTTYQERAKLGHSYTNYVSNNDVTCTQDGTKTAACDYGCGKTNTITDKAAGHKIVTHEGKAPTCTAIGWYAYETCENCSYTTYQERAATGHTIVTHEAKEPTCTAIGWYAYEACENCSYTTYQERAATGHKIVAHEGKAPTCTEIGWYAYETCENCSYTTYEERAKLGHSYTNYVSNNDATCTQDGTKTAACDNGCGKTDTIADEAAGHKIVAHEAKEPTCTEIGWYAYETCENCSYTTYQERAATGHTIVTHEAKEPTCTEIGWYAYETCENCSYTTYEERVKLGHSYTNYISNNDATCTQDGTKTATCDNGCGKTDTVTDENTKTEHNWIDGGCVSCSMSVTYVLNSDKASYSVTDIGTYGATSLTIPATYNNLPVTSIGDYAFSGCSGLTSVVIGDSVTTIGEYAFKGCSSLTSVVIGNGVTSIGDYAFKRCSSLTGVYITDIAAWCNISFSGGESTNPLYYAKKLYLNNELVADLVIPDTVTEIKDDAFYNCSNLTSIEIPDSVTYIGGYAFSGCSGLTSVYITDIAAWCNISFSSYGTANPLCYAKKLYLNNQLVTDLVIPDTVTGIKGHAFRGCSSLTSIEISDSVTFIGGYAFSDCSGLTSIEIPDSVTSIGDYAFAYCGSLTSIEIPDSVTFIGDSAFVLCSSLTGVYITDITAWCNISFSGGESTNPLLYANNLYLNNELVTDVVIPDTKTRIKSYTFAGCSSLTSVLIPDSVTSIGDSAFASCSSLTSVVIPDRVTSIGRYAFGGCSSLTSIEIPDRVTSIGDGAFNYCSGLTSVVIPDRVTSIGNNAFQECSSLTSVVIGNGVTSIGREVFYNCSRLTSVVIGDGVTSIGMQAFRGCSGLTSIEIPASVTSIGNCAFYVCSGLTSITFEGTVAEWNAISKGSNWNYNVPATEVVCNDGTVAL